MLTTRLELRPNDPRHLLALIEGDEQYEQAAGFKAADGLRDFFVSDEVSAEWLEQLRSGQSADAWRFGFAVIERGSNRAIGSAGFKGPPDTEGVVEIAYGIVSAYQGKGLATEVAQALVTFASRHEETRRLRAHTLPETNASNAVLTKCGFQFVGDVIDPEDGTVWRWERDPEA